MGWDKEWYSCIHFAGYACISTKVRNKTEYINKCILFNSTSMILYVVCFLLNLNWLQAFKIETFHWITFIMSCKKSSSTKSISVPKRIIHWMLPSLDRICALYFITLDLFFFYLHYIAYLVSIIILIWKSST